MSSLRISRRDKVHTSTGSLDSDGDSGIDVTGFAPHVLPIKRTVTGYYTPFSGYLNQYSALSSTTLSPSHPPPSYDDTRNQPSLQPGRNPVWPREEEGREQLPEYYCSVHREAVFYTKMELRTPFDRATDRSWNKEYVVLHGTLLRLHKARRIPFFASPDMRSRLGEDGSTRPEGWMPGELTKSYTLQGAEVGIATDYKKRHFVIRVRAETEQFLLASKSVDECIAWLEALSAAVDLSPALEERTLPRYQMTPRRRRAPVIEEQERIIRSQFPHLIESMTEEEDEGGSRRDSISDRDELIRSPPLRGMRGPGDSEEPITGPPTSISASANRPSSGGKWRPSDTLTPEANLRYARRCMAVLRDDSPRLSDYIIKDGRRYRVAWDKKQLVPEGVNDFIGNRYWRTAALPHYEDLIQGREVRVVNQR
ncbi:PH domain-like protein [Terfezia boudieri ATCC MYA-4762]|uniref:PH domain-like protein n=1 Tax=Terfezia boudieri ATCC MYA-4762 TaxID=1051890 RepID=A0A3N4MFA9_9PEZI|nr:PH domain-like protein [Terfezia boudieri ATCC MYA-4762]